MKKEKLITRTIVSTLANVKVFSKDENAVSDITVEFAGKLDEKEIKETFEKVVASKGVYCFIMVNNFEKVERLYGVTESDFMKIAVELPPRKVNNAQEDE